GNGIGAGLPKASSADMVGKRCIVKRKGMFQTLTIGVVAAACAKDSTPFQGVSSADDASMGDESHANGGSSSGGRTGMLVGGDAESSSARDSAASRPEGATLGPEGATSSSGTTPSGGEAGAEAGAFGTDSDIASIVAGVSADRISQRIQTLVAFGTRSSCS